MTRLTENWVKEIIASVHEQERDLMFKTKMNLLALAAKSSSQSPEALKLALKDVSVAVVSITGGLGVISSFAESVSSILKTMGVNAFVTEATDVSGVCEAYEKQANVIFMADDNKFIAINTKTRALSDNNRATAKGFITALEGMSGNLLGKEVLVLGCGIVGMEAISYLKDKKAIPVAFDIDNNIMKSLKGAGVITISSQKEFRNYSLIFDATPTGAWLDSALILEDAYISAPGLPLSLNDDTRKAFEPRLIHDYLPIGVCVMLGDVMKNA